MKIRLNYFSYPVLAAATLLFFFGGPDYYACRFHKSVWNLGHILYYILVSYIVLRQWKRFSLKSFHVQLSGLFIFCMLSGVAIELIQVNFKRIPEWGDLWRDFLGILLGIVLFSESFKSVSPLTRRFIKIIGVLFLMAEIIPSIRAVSDEMIARKQFPLLSGFETPWETDRWESDNRLNRRGDIVREGKYAASTLLTTERYSGLSLKYFPRDWSTYRFLRFSIFNTLDDTLYLTCRIHDRTHIENQQPFSDRFNKRLILEPGWNSWEIPVSEIRTAPLGRQMDLSRVYNLGFFSSNLSFPVVIYIDEVKLLP